MGKAIEQIQGWKLYKLRTRAGAMWQKLRETILSLSYQFCFCFCFGSTQIFLADEGVCLMSLKILFSKKQDDLLFWYMHLSAWKWGCFAVQLQETTPIVVHIDSIPWSWAVQGLHTLMQLTTLLKIPLCLWTAFVAPLNKPVHSGFYSFWLVWQDLEQ